MPYARRMHGFEVGQRVRYVRPLRGGVEVSIGTAGVVVKFELSRHAPWPIHVSFDGKNEPVVVHPSEIEPIAK